MKARDKVEELQNEIDPRYATELEYNIRLEISEVKRSQKEYGDALNKLENILTEISSRNYREKDIRAKCRYYYGKTYIENKEYEQAFHNFKEAKLLFSEIGKTRKVLDSIKLKIHTLLALGRVERAVEMCNEYDRVINDSSISNLEQHNKFHKLVEDIHN